MSSIIVIIGHKTFKKRVLMSADYDDWLSYDVVPEGIENKDRFYEISTIIRDALMLDIANPGFMISEQEQGLRSAAIHLGTIDYYRYFPFRIRTLHRFGNTQTNLIIPFEFVISKLDEEWRPYSYYLGVGRINRPSWNQLSNPNNFDRYLLGVNISNNNQYDIMKTIAYETYEHLSTGNAQYEVDRMHSTINVTCPFGTGQLIIDHHVGFKTPCLVEPSKVDFLCKFISLRFIEAVIQARSAIELDADFTISTEALKNRYEKLKEEVDHIKKYSLSYIVKFD